MKTKLPWIIAGLVALWPLYTLLPRHDEAGGFAYKAFGALPVLSNGRVQPLDSLARNSLLQLHDKQTLAIEPWKTDTEDLTATQWLMEMLMKPEQADTRPVFRIDHPELKGLLKLPLDGDPAKQTDGKNFSLNQFKERMPALQRESMRASQLKDQQRNQFDQAVMRLASGVSLYMKLQNTLQPQNAQDWEKEFAGLRANLPAAMKAAQAQAAKQEFDQVALDRVMNDLRRVEEMGEREPPLLVPPVQPDGPREGWKRMNEALIDMARGQPISFAVESYAHLSGAYKNNRVIEFNQLVADYRNALRETHPGDLRKVGAEQYFNDFSPFYTAMCIYLLAGLLAIFYWFSPAQFELVRQTAFSLIVLAWVVHTSGLIFRMVLEGRPPVTNLYSSAVFIGWGVVVFGMVLEAVWKRSIGICVAAVLGFTTLIIAHHLAMMGDTMEMMRAVLDTNFWLATHVVVVTLGYAATFVAGAIGIVGIVAGVIMAVFKLPRNPASKPFAGDLMKVLAKMIYGVICFATLFSFVGTVLGGIWADQSWGRFWGWDPKENGALIIVLWNALVLHARWGGLVRERGLMNLAIGGNIVTAWSWFGVNMLGIGLHSYGFTNAAFFYLSFFVVSQLGLIFIGSLFWRKPPGGGAASAPLEDAATAA
jgi:ABC-type transport system involved in cytochrome c biogenesis permease subunit